MKERLRRTAARAVQKPVSALLLLSRHPEVNQSLSSSFPPSPETGINTLRHHY